MAIKNDDEIQHGMDLMNEALRRQKFLVRKLFGRWVVLIPDGLHVQGDFECYLCALAYAIESARTWQWT